MSEIKEQRPAGTAMNMFECNVCGAGFESAVALHGHKGGRRGQCGTSALDTMWAALVTLLDNAVLKGRDEYHITTADYDAARAALPNG